MEKSSAPRAAHLPPPALTDTLHRSHTASQDRQLREHSIAPDAAFAGDNGVALPLPRLAAVCCSGVLAQPRVADLRHSGAPQRCPAACTVHERIARATLDL